VKKGLRPRGPSGFQPSPAPSGGRRGTGRWERTWPRWRSGCFWMTSCRRGLRRPATRPRRKREQRAERITGGTPPPRPRCRSRV